MGVRSGNPRAAALLLSLVPVRSSPQRSPAYLAGLDDGPGSLDVESRGGGGCVEELVDKKWAHVVFIARVGRHLGVGDVVDVDDIAHDIEVVRCEGVQSSGRESSGLSILVR